MTTQRLYKYATVFNARIVGMRHLWEPSREYQGQPTQKPNYLTSIIIPKTRGQWFEEPQFAGFVTACQELYQGAMSHIPFPQVIWPVKDGDVPEPGKSAAEWSKGHWFLSGSSSSPINVEVVQNGTPVKLQNRAIVKPGDFVALSCALAVKKNDPRGVKCYVNSVLFMASGEEIAIGNSVSGTELMAQARAQGLNVTGFGGAAPGGFNPGGFQNNAPGSFQAPAPAQPAPDGFGAVGQPTTTGFQAPAPAQPNQGGFAANPAQPAAFAPPAGGFTPPQGFPPR